MCSGVVLDIITSTIVSKAEEIFAEKLKSVILYGSYARGDNRDESDIDIMILVDMKDEDLKNYYKYFVSLMSDVSLEYDVLLSPVILNKNQFEKYKKEVPFFENVMKEGVVIYAQ